MNSPVAFRLDGAVRTLMMAVLVVVSARAAGETVIVTGTRIPVSIERFGGSVTVITSQDIKLNQYRGITDALAGIPGVHVAPTGGIGAQSSVFMRGTESNHVLVLIDGIEVTNPYSGLFAFEHLQLSDVERIEVLRGPYSAQYGSEALGGVINVITRRGVGDPAAEARLESGSFGTRSAGVNFSGQSDRIDFSIGGAWLQTDGQSFTPRRLRGGDGAERDGYDNLDVKISAGVDFSDSSRVDFRFGYIAADTQFDGNSTPFEASALKSSVYERRYSANWSGDYARSFWQPSLRGSYYTGQFSATGAIKTRADRSKVEWRNDFLFSESMKFVAGLETELEEASTDGKHSARTDAIYLQAWLEPFRRLFLSGGWRHDDPDDFGSDHNWQLAARYASSAFKGSLHASYGTAFKAPTLGDRFGSGGNPDLDPESSYSWEIGAGQNLAIHSGAFNVGWGVTWFNNEIRNLIFFDLVDFRLKNVQSADIEGLESFISLNTAEGFGVRVDTTVMRAYDDDRRRLLRRPLRKGRLEVSWSGNPEWMVSAKVDYIGRQQDIKRDDFSRVTKGGYTLAGISGRRKINEDLAFYLRVNNLLDKDYEPIDGYAGRGVEAYIGLDFNL